MASETELDRLRALNAELVSALEEALPGLSDLVAQGCAEPTIAERDRHVLAQIRAAIAKARGEPGC